MMAIEKQPVKRKYRIEKKVYHPVRIVRKESNRKRKVLPPRVVKPYPIPQEKPCFQAIQELAQAPKFVHHELDIPYYYERTQQLIGIDKVVSEILETYQKGDKKPVEPKLKSAPKHRAHRHYTVHQITPVRKQTLGNPRPRNMTMFLSEGNDTTFSLDSHRKQRVEKKGWRRFVEANYFRETWMALLVIALVLLLFLVWNDDEQQTMILLYAFLATSLACGGVLLLSLLIGTQKRTRRRKHGNR